MAIISLVLTASYVLTSRNVQSAQKIREQGQALKLVERQVELLRANSSTPPECYDVNGTAAYGPACRVTALGNVAPASYDGAIFKIAIGSPASGVYPVSATWETLGGSQANVTVYYKK